MRKLIFQLWAAATLAHDAFKATRVTQKPTVTHLLGGRALSTQRGAPSEAQACVCSLECRRIKSLLFDWLQRVVPEGSAGPRLHSDFTVTFYNAARLKWIFWQLISTQAELFFSGRKWFSYLVLVQMTSSLHSMCILDGCTGDDFSDQGSLAFQIFACLLLSEPHFNIKANYCQHRETGGPVLCCPTSLLCN